MTQTALQQYAARKLKADVSKMLRDPSSFGTPRELRAGHIPFLQKVAIQCGLNWNRLLSEIGSPYEQERLKRIAAGQPHDARSIGPLSNERPQT